MEQEPSVEQHLGEHYLGLLGMQAVAGEQVPVGEQTIYARDFLDVCGDHALPMLKGLERMAAGDQRDRVTAVLRRQIGRYLGYDDEKLASLVQNNNA